MCKLAGSKAPMQSYQIEPSDISGFIKEKWDESYSVIYAGG